MTTKPATLNGATKSDAKYLALIDKYLAEADAIHRDNVRKREKGRKVSANIRRQLKEIKTILARVESTL